MADNYTVRGSDIRDLKVVELPREMQKGKKKQNYVQDQMVFSATPDKKKIKGKRNVYANDEDVTWDDVSMIKTGSEFDFAGSTAEFDKQSAMEEFEVNDNVDSSMRLVGHNKIKTKYDHDENVIQNKMDKWEDSTLSRVTAAPSNKEASKQLLALIQSKPDSVRRSPSLETRGFQLISRSKDHLPLATPVQLLEIERLCFENYKVSPQIVTENSSRGIASLVIKMLGGSSRILKSNHNLPPLVLLLIGNNRSGARALATGRQLLNHGIRVIAYTISDFEKTEDLDEHVKEQLEMFLLFGGKTSFTMNSLSSLITSLETPPEFVVDGLQGYDTSLGDLWGTELENATGIINWVNTQDITVLALDIPSGVDAGSGLLSDATPINAKFVVSSGLPVNGLVLAYSNQVVNKGDWIHYLVDIGIASKLFKQGKFRKFDRSWFDGDFVVDLEIQDK
jgi:enhancer of mRNA-decapping protein 3